MTKQICTPRRNTNCYKKVVYGHPQENTYCPIDCETTLCCDSTEPTTTQGQELLALFNSMCENFDPDYDPSASIEQIPGMPVCITCLPANPALAIIFDSIADILEQ